MLAPTPPDRLTDAQGRPYFLWDVDMTLAEFRSQLASADEGTRAYWAGKLMRQAKPDDVFTFLKPADILALWPRLERYLGRQRPFWQWLRQRWLADAR